MQVKKRSGQLEPVSFDKITDRIEGLCWGLDRDYVDPTKLAQKVVSGLFDGIETTKLDNLAAETAASMAVDHPDYAMLAGRIAISSLHKETDSSFSKVVKQLNEYVDPKTGEAAPLVADWFADFVSLNAAKLDSMIDSSKDYRLDYFGFKTLERAYLLKLGDKIVERPQYMFMRAAIEVTGADMDKIDETYLAMVDGFYTHATPTLFNSGTNTPQLSSCFLLDMTEDSITGIYETLSRCAKISQSAGGIGIAASKIRAKGSYIKGTGGQSNGLVPMMRVYNDTARYVDQGGGRRKGAFAMYLEPWHSDIFDFLDLKKNHGKEEQRARDLFYAMWIPDLFMERVEQDGVWSLMCPNECPDLQNTYGDEFKALYEEYEAQGRYKEQVKARKVWNKILESQIETGTPYMLYKDAANKKSNQKNIGVIKSSNLCVAPETLLLTDKGEFPIKELHGQSVNVWNGKEWSATEVMQTGRNQKLYKVVFSNGAEIECTAYHKFYIIEKGEVVVRRCCDLFEGQLIAPYTLGPNTSLNDAVKIAKLVDDNRFDDTFCVKEPKEGKAVFNGVLTGNCTEILEYTDKDEVAVCNLASIALPRFVVNGKFDFNKFVEIVRLATRNLDTVIDRNFYPVPQARNSNVKHRPIGLGVQGLADVFAMLRMPFDSYQARMLNKDIFEAMYFAAVTESCQLAKEKGQYLTYKGSPASQGQLQFDLWGVEPSDRFDWKALKEDIAKYGLRNSLLVAPMPTASTSQIMGNNECFEPYTSNIYTRRTLSGEHIVVNKHLLKDLVKLGVWDSEMKEALMAANGSVQNIEGLPQSLKDLYKTAYELKQKVLIDMSADRGAFVCQSQSLNLFMESPTFSKLTSMHFYAWKKGLKTGMYYLRSKAAVDPIKFTLSAKHQRKFTESELDNGDDCLMCGS